MAQGRILVAQGRLLVAQGTILVAQGSISGFGKNNNEDMSQKDQGMTARKPSKHIISDSGKNKIFKVRVLWGPGTNMRGSEKI